MVRRGPDRLAGGTGTLVILCPYHAKICSDARWSKEMVRDYIWGHTKISAAGIRNCYKHNPDLLLPPWRWLLDLSEEEAARTSLPKFNNPDRIEIAAFSGGVGKILVMHTNDSSATVEINHRAG